MQGCAYTDNFTCWCEHLAIWLTFLFLGLHSCYGQGLTLLVDLRETALLPIVKRTLNKLQLVTRLELTMQTVPYTFKETHLSYLSATFLNKITL